MQTDERSLYGIADYDRIKSELVAAVDDPVRFDAVLSDNFLAFG
jgi:hypothetical protein